MSYIFEIKDFSHRKIHLSRERWKHINQEHPEVSPYIEEIKETLRNPDKIKTYEDDLVVKYYYNYYKGRASSVRYLLLVVKYLNGDGFVITAYFVRNIR